MVTGWDQIIAEASRRYAVPESLIRSAIQVESGGRRDAVSAKGAGGLMQVMPDTYAELAGRHGLGPDRFDPRNNITAGAAYIRQGYDQFGNWNDALAAYNAGPGRVSQVKAGSSAMPAETTDYLNNPALKGVLAQFEQNKRADMPMFAGRAGGATDDEMDAWTARPGLGGLLNLGTQNWHEGLGLLGPYGQTASHPPGPGGAAGAPAPPPGPGAPASGGYDVGARISELIQELAQKPKAEPALSRGQYQLAGAGAELGKLADVHNRPVGIGEMLGALGRGVSGGTLAAQQATRDERSNQFGELGNLAKLQTYQRTESTAAAKVVAAKQYAKQLRDSGDPTKVQLATALENDPTLIDEIVKAQAAGAWPKDQGPKSVQKNGWIYENGKWIQPPGGGETGGPLEGTAVEAQWANIYVGLNQKLARGEPLTPQEQLLYPMAQRALTEPKQTVNAAGQVVLSQPPPLPTLGGGQVPGAAPAPASTQNVEITTPDGGKVTTIGGKNLPAGEVTAIRKQMDTLNKLRGSATALTESVTKTGLQLGGFGELGGRQAALYEDVQTQLRLANELGVLNGPDERKLLEQLSNPTAFWTMIKGGGGVAYFNAQMKVLQEKIDRELGMFRQRIGEPSPAPGSGSATTRLKLDSQGNIIK
jgi:hypothetical protein